MNEKRIIAADDVIDAGSGDSEKMTNNIVINNNDNNITTTPTTTSSSSILLLERKIAIATEGLLDYVAKRLRKLKTKENIETICNYIIIAMNMEINPSLMYKKNQILVLCQLAEFYNNNNNNNNLLICQRILFDPS